MSDALTKKDKWLVRPAPFRDEGVQGYLHRLLEANGVQFRKIRKNFSGQGAAAARLQFAWLNYGEQILGGLEEKSISTFHKLEKYARFCPQCLAERAYWRQEWEVQFYDVCHVHYTTLIDECEFCGTLITWLRKRLLSCDCGAAFQNFKTATSPSASAMLSHWLSYKLDPTPHRGPPNSARFLSMFSLSHFQKLIQFIGAYGTFAGRSWPQKIPQLDRLKTSWHLTSIASEVLAQWPSAFHLLLRNLSVQPVEDGDWRISRRFGHFYGHLYRELSDGVFDELRKEFETYVAEHWDGPLAGRNKRLSKETIKSASWISGLQARRHLKISSHAFDIALKTTGVEVRRRTGARGRVSLLVRRHDLQVLAHSVQYVDLAQSSRLLGLTRQRLRELAPVIFQDVIKSDKIGASWRIPVRSIETLLKPAECQPILMTVSPSQITMQSVLKYWRWPDSKLVQFLNALVDGDVQVVGCWSACTGIAAYIFDRSTIENWLHPPQDTTHLTVPAFAKAIGVKQEVAYFWVRAGFINADRENGSSHISPAAVLNFQKKYVLATELAKQIHTSSRALRDRLRSIELFPISGPGIDGCRQTLYLRSPLLREAMKVLASC